MDCLVDDASHLVVRYNSCSWLIVKQRKVKYISQKLVWRFPFFLQHSRKKTNKQKQITLFISLYFSFWLYWESFTQISKKLANLTQSIKPSKLRLFWELVGGSALHKDVSSIFLTLKSSENVHRRDICWYIFTS